MALYLPKLDATDLETLRTAKLHKLIKHERDTLKQFYHHPSRDANCQLGEGSNRVHMATLLYSIAYKICRLSWVPIHRIGLGERGLNFAKFVPGKLDSFVLCFHPPVKLSV